MTAIWHNDGTQWKILAPSGFPDEASLHALVEQEPRILPLAGSPQLVIVGREVRLGSGYADLIAVEPSGRLAVIEIKLSRNAEARRAVISQVLAYASYLFRLSVDDLERDVLRSHLRERDYSSLADAISRNDQEGSFDESEFVELLGQNLAEGRFRLVFVLDSAPEELISLASFLEAISDKLLIDLVAVSSFHVNGEQIIVPQRITPEEKQRVPEYAPERKPASRNYHAAGSSEFRRATEVAPVEARPYLDLMTEWAEELESGGAATLSTTVMDNGLSWSLRPLVSTDNAGLVTIFNWRGKPYLAFYRSVFERRAPISLSAVESTLAPVPLGQGNQIEGHSVTQELLAAIATAYHEAAGASLPPAAEASAMGANGP